MGMCLRVGWPRTHLMRSRPLKFGISRSTMARSNDRRLKCGQRVEAVLGLDDIGELGDFPRTTAREKASSSTTRTDGLRIAPPSASLVVDRLDQVRSAGRLWLAGVKEIVRRCANREPDCRT